jgi:hypothetical protein
MKILYAGTYTLCLLTAIVWFPSHTQVNAQTAPQVLTQAQLDALVQQNLNTPVPCSCDKSDENDLKSRAAGVKAAIAGFAAEKRNYAGSKQTVTPAIRNTVQQPIRKQIYNARLSGAKDYGATTYDFGCFTIIDFSATGCLRGALDEHESVHRKVCSEHPLGFRFDQLVEDWLQEEIDAYTKELKRLNDELSNMLPFCNLHPSVRRVLWEIDTYKKRDAEAAAHIELFWGY